VNSDTCLFVLKKRLLKNLPILRPASAKLKGVDPLLFQQDGTKPQAALIMDQDVEERGIEVFDWPSKSLDLN